MCLCGVGCDAAGADSVEARAHDGVGDEAGMMMVPKGTGGGAGGGGEVDAGAVRGASLSLGGGREESESDQAAAAGLSQQAWHAASPHACATERGVRSHRDAMPWDARRGWTLSLSACLYVHIYTHIQYTCIHIYTFLYTYIGWISPDAVGAGAVAPSSSQPNETSRQAAAADGRVSARGGERMGWCPEIRPESGCGGGGGSGGSTLTDSRNGKGNGQSNGQSNGSLPSSCAQGIGVSGRYTRVRGGSICRVMSSAQYVRESLSFVRTMCAARQKLGVSPMAHILKSTQ